jgi:hypothetical protein
MRALQRTKKNAEEDPKNPPHAFLNQNQRRLTVFPMDSVNADLCHSSHGPNCTQISSNRQQQEQLERQQQEQLRRQQQERLGRQQQERLGRQQQEQLGRQQQERLERQQQERLERQQQERLGQPVALWS